MGANQCVYYRKCSRTENIANQILLSTDKEEKARLIDEFKALRCGNFHSQKTVCCDQDKIQNRDTNLAFDDKNTNETAAIEFLAEYNERYGKLLNEYTLASWNYETNITNENEEISQEAGVKLSAYNEEALEIASIFDAT